MGARVGPATRGLWMLGWLAGAGLQLQQARLWHPGIVLALAAVALVVALLVWRWRRRWAAVVVLTACCLALGFAFTAGRAELRLRDRLPAALEGQDLLVTGVVAELPRGTLAGTRFVLQTEGAMLQGAPVMVPAKLSLGWYRGVDDDDLLAAPAETLRPGQRWLLPLRLRQPHGGLNPHGFDLELWLFERGIGATGYVRSRPGRSAVKLSERDGQPVERLRQQIRDSIQAHVADPTTAGVLAALAIGDQAAIDREGWELFRNTGVAHLMSISGLHVTMFAWLAGGLVGWLWRRHPRLPLLCPGPLAARWGGLFAATGYALVAGWGVPAQRTLWMIGVVVLLRSAGVRWPLPLVLVVAAVAVAVADPWALLQPGFWLSFAAVALLVAAEPAQAAVESGLGWRHRLRAWLGGGVRSQAVATIGLAPLSLLFFHQVSVVGFAANLIAIPLVTLVITPLTLLGMLVPPLWQAAAWLVQALSTALQQLAAWPWAVWTSAAPPTWAMACGLLGGLVAVVPLPWRLRVLALPLMLPMLWPPVPRPSEGQFELVAADVGQGTAVLVRTREHLLVFDTGPGYSPEADAGSRVLVPLLRARGERRIHLLMLSHRDSDHVGGAASLLAALPVDKLSSSLNSDHPLLQRGPPHVRCDAGQRWSWDGVHFEVLHPLPAEHAAARKPNAASCVLKVQGSQLSALLTGDIESAQEAALVQRLGGALRADVLQVPHHGSRTSSTAAFVDAVAPRVAFVQAAYRSRFGHPAPDVMARYEQRGIEVVRSDRCGAWTLPLQGGAVCERQRGQRYWHHSAAGPQHE
ncbi:MAG TPA: DNA internalization-related competence protein ComEC/Rec2 [Rubrivivax sp.]|nr:DNA internalization-related competence protein ComEC/Rec2 [Rubrivivax sp.]